MRVDLYTDAGVRMRDGLGTWAVVAIATGSSEPIFEASGQLRDKTGDSTTAELRAIANALHRLIRRGDLVRGNVVRIFTDSRNAVARIDGTQKRRPQSSMAHATTVILKLAEVHGLELSAHWIKGHRPSSADVHARWNNRCDKLCQLARTAKDDGRPSAPADAQPLAKTRTKARIALDIARRLESGA